MKKRIFSLALVFALAIALVPAFTPPAQAAEPWRSAYAAYLKNGGIVENYGKDLKFGLTDMDGDGIPELVLTHDIWKSCFALTYSAGAVIELGSYYGDVYSWAWPHTDGILVDEDRGSFSTFWTLRNGKMVEVPFTNSDSLEVYPITDANIQDVIYGSGATPNTNPHPYATALREFMAGGGETEAWLADINGDGSKEMLAIHYEMGKVGILQAQSVTYRLYYIYNGELRTYEETMRWEHGMGPRMFLTFTDRLAFLAYSDYLIYSLTDGKVDHFRISDDQIGQYGIDWMRNNEMYNRPDQTAQILAMTATPSTSLDTASGWAKDGITQALSKGFIPSDLQNNYQNVITRAEFCRMAVKFVEYKTGKGIDAVMNEKGLTRNFNAFADTNDPDILAAAALGITAGTGGGLFTPNGDFSREQAATMIRNTCKAAGMDISNVTAAGFEDIGTASSWAVDGINFARNNGIMSGTSTTPLLFSPKGTYTREQSIITFNNIQP